MTLQQLKFIVALAEHLNFGRAAEACYVSQPSLSVGIRQLEEYLGMVIFQRDKGRKGVTITPDGHQIIEMARGILFQSAKLRASAKLAGKSNNVGAVCLVGAVGHVDFVDMDMSSGVLH